jgi:EpsD family peptidyl-prolyl cis-trans isomerase
MKRGISFLMVGLMLASCGNGDKGAPKGQVVATVDGQEITAAELRMEMGNALSDPSAAAAAQQTALQGLISRKLLVAEAKRRELEKSPMASMYRARAEDLALIQLLQMSIASGVPKVSDDEVKDYISSHPASFAARRLISVDQLLVGKIDPKVIQQMAPLKTMPEIEALLTNNKVQYVRSAAVLDTLNLNPEAAAKIGGMPNDEIVAVPNGSGVQVARIVSSRVEPLAGEEADRIARLMLMQQRGASQVRTAMEDVVKNGQSKVHINPAYAPKPGPAPAAAKPAASPKPAAN